MPHFSQISSGSVRGTLASSLGPASESSIILLILYITASVSLLSVVGARLRLVVHLSTTHTEHPPGIEPEPLGLIGRHRVRILPLSASALADSQTHYPSVLPLHQGVLCDVTQCYWFDSVGDRIQKKMSTNSFTC